MYILSEKNNNKVGDMKTIGSSKPNPYLIGGYVVIEDMSVICKTRCDHGEKLTFDVLCSVSNRS